MYIFCISANKRVVTFKSTVSTCTWNGNKNRNKLVKRKWNICLVYNYKKQMWGVNVQDHMLNSLLLERKRRLKWYMKVFKRLLIIYVPNFYIIWKSKNHKIDHLVFRLELLKGCRSVAQKKKSLWMDGYLLYKRRSKPRKGAVFVTIMEWKRKVKSKWCPEFEMGLCIGSYFNDYHTKLNFWLEAQYNYWKKWFI